MNAPRFGPLTAVLLLAALHMLVFDRGLGGDGWAGFATLESLVDDGDAFVEDDHRGVMNGLVGTATGHLVMQYPPGILVLDALPFLAGRGLDRLLPSRWLADGADLPPAGRVSRGVFFSAAAITLARNAASLLGILWIALALQRLGRSRGIAAAAAGLAFFGGPMIFYSLVGMTHAPVFALGGLLLWILVRQREDGGLHLALAAGAVVGAAVLLRYGSVALLAPALVAVSHWRSRLTGFAGVAGFTLALSPLPLWWRLSSGHWRPTYGGGWELTAASPWNVLFSPVHGLFLFHPALLFAAAGLATLVVREARRREIGWGTIASVWFLAVAVLYGWWSEWANVGGYGQRFLIDALPALAVGFAGFLGGAGQRAGLRTALGGAALFGYLLFFAAVGRLVPPPPPHPWPQRLSDYAPLIDRPPAPGDLARALREASFLVR
jgi:hypothetical protein